MEGHFQNYEENVAPDTRVFYYEIKGEIQLVGEGKSTFPCIDNDYMYIIYRVVTVGSLQVQNEVVRRRL